MPSNLLVPRLDDSPLALEQVELGPHEETHLAVGEDDHLLYVVAADGSLTLDDAVFLLRPGDAGLVLAGEQATISAGGSGLSLVHGTVGPEADRHAPLGVRETLVRNDGADTEQASGARSFRLLLGPHNGSTRATLFVGFVPPGKAPWHYHLYDEIVWIPEGPGRLHRDGSVTELGPGAAFRLRPREVHIVENASPDRELRLLGLLTPAGSPAAAYLTPDVAAEYGLRTVGD